ncbi:MAG TPA: hypothetical protein VHL34_24840 [Rhizomicrobium sp.]|jgi:hypothetical protein|nr:hypothetical protein [Rhizomicrobium sp.]
MSWRDAPVTLFRAMKLPNGKVVCVDARVISETTKIVRNSDEYYKALGQGWCDDPAEALERFERAEETIGNLAAERAAQDLKMSALAQEEAAAYEKTVSTHVPVIPEARR